jgi:hypothetical protein
MCRMKQDGTTGDAICTKACYIKIPFARLRLISPSFKLWFFEYRRVSCSAAKTVCYEDPAETEEMHSIVDAESCFAEMRYLRL